MSLLSAVRPATSLFAKNNCETAGTLASKSVETAGSIAFNFETAGSIASSGSSSGGSSCGSSCNCIA